MKRILVPTDFSDTAMKAITYAAEIAERNGAVIYLLHVMEPIIDGIRQPHPLHEKLLEEITNNRLSELKSLEECIAESYPELKIVAEFTNGTVINSIHDYAIEQSIDLIIMGTSGASGLKEIFMGSVAAGTIGRTRIPVLAIPREYLMEAPHTILLATNHFEKSEDLLNPIVELASLFSATIHVAVFIDADEARSPDYLYNTRQLNYYVDVLSKMYPGTAFKGELLEGSKFEETIEKYDERNEVDIIAMITYPKSLRKKIMRKSRTKKMAFHSAIPLLAIPATIVENILKDADPPVEMPHS